MQEAPKLIAVVGPTASGKTELAIEFAKKFNGEVISADSRQIYKEMDIGTGKPELVKWKKRQATGNLNSIPHVAIAMSHEGIPHHLIDIKNPNEPYTAAEYKRDALQAIDEIITRGKLPILAGGTGLYVRAVIDNLEIPNVPANPQLRKKLERELEKNGLESLFEKLVALDPEAEYIVDGKNPRRVIRALEIALTLHKPFSETQKKGSPLFKVLEIGIKVPQNELHKRIAARVDAMFRRGLVAEVKRLVKKYGEKCPAFDAIGYREALAYLGGTISKESAKALMKKNTCAYAKRQITWFRKDTNIRWIQNKKEALLLLKKFLRPAPMLERRQAEISGGTV